MKITIKTKNLELTDALREYINKKIIPIQKFISILKEDTQKKGKALAEVIIEVERTTKHHRKGEIFRAEARIILPKKNIMVEEVSDDLYKAIVEIKKELIIEIKKYKLKISEARRREQRKSKRTLLAG